MLSIKHIVNPVLLAAILTLPACTFKSDPYEMRKPIRFLASLDYYQTRATDTAFEEGDAIGVSIGEPVGINNLRLVMQNGKLIPDTPAYWLLQQPSSPVTSFWAYYPYAADKDLSEGFDFTIQADQSTHTGFTASDLMVAATTASPADDAVMLPFRHRLSKLVLQIDNQLGSEISEVYVGNVFGKAFVRVDDLEVKGGKGTVKACPVTLTGGVQAWTLVLVPQSATPVLMVTTTDQKQYTFTLEEDIALLSCYRDHASVMLGESSVSTDFTADVSEWTDNSEIQFASQ